MFKMQRQAVKYTRLGRRDSGRPEKRWTYWLHIEGLGVGNSGDDDTGAF